MFIFHPMVSVTVFIVSRGSHWPDAYFSMCDIKSLSIYLSIYLSIHYLCTCICLLHLEGCAIEYNNNNNTKLNNPLHQSDVFKYLIEAILNEPHIY